MASAVIKRDTLLKSIDNIPERSLRQKGKDKDAKPTRPRAIPKTKPTPAPTAVKETKEVKEVKEPESVSDKITRVRRIYSREFLIKFKYSAPAFDSDVQTPADLIAQYNKEFEKRILAHQLLLQQQAQQEQKAPPQQAVNTAVPESISAPVAHKDAEMTNGIAQTKTANGTENRKKETGEKKEKTYKLRLPGVGTDDSILKSPMFRNTAKSSTASAKRSSIVPSVVADDKENGTAPTSKAPRSSSATKTRPAAKKVKKAEEKPVEAIPTPSATIPVPAPSSAPAVSTPSPIVPSPSVPTPSDVPTLPAPAPSTQVPMETDSEAKSAAVKDDLEIITDKLKSTFRELEPRRLSQRQKQIDYGKATPGYAAYVGLVAKSKRKREDPKTPNRNQICSKRSWDGQIRKWRRMLHFYDPPELQGKPHDDDLGLDEKDDVETDDVAVASQ